MSATRSHRTASRTSSSGGAKITVSGSLVLLIAVFCSSCEPIPPHVIALILYVLGFIILWVVFMVISAIACPVLASRSGRNPVGYFFLGFFLSIVGLVITVWVTDRPFSTILKIVGIPIVAVSIPLLFFNGLGAVVFAVLGSIAGVLAGATWLMCNLATSEEAAVLASNLRDTSFLKKLYPSVILTGAALILLSALTPFYKTSYNTTYRGIYNTFVPLLFSVLIGFRALESLGLFKKDTDQNDALLAILFSSLALAVGILFSIPTGHYIAASDLTLLNRGIYIFIVGSIVSLVGSIQMLYVKWPRPPSDSQQINYLSNSTEPFG